MQVAIGIDKFPTPVLYYSLKHFYMKPILFLLPWLLGLPFMPMVYGQIEPAGKVYQQVIPVYGNQTGAYQAVIRDVLADFQISENIHLQIGDQGIKFNLDAGRTSATQLFRTDKPGLYTYKVWGIARHRDGHQYTLYGTGQIQVGTAGAQFDLYGYPDEASKTVMVWLQPY